MRLKRVNALGYLSSYSLIRLILHLSGFVLLESGSFLLLEDGSKLILE